MPSGKSWILTSAGDPVLCDAVDGSQVIVGVVVLSNSQLLSRFHAALPAIGDVTLASGVATESPHE